jgi:hypothetical protein
MFGHIIAFLFYVGTHYAILTGRVKIQGDTRKKGIKETEKQQGTLVFANHPSLIETIIVPALYWSIVPTGNKYKQVWSVSDARLYPQCLHRGLRIIPVSRTTSRDSKQTNTRALFTIRRVLESGGTVFCTPEGGRTIKGEHFIKNDFGDKVVRTCHDEILRLARLCGAELVPVWVDHGVITSTENYLSGLVKLLNPSKAPMVVTFGKPFHGEITPETIAEALIKTGGT